MIRQVDLDEDTDFSLNTVSLDPGIDAGHDILSDISWSFSPRSDHDLPLVYDNSRRALDAVKADYQPLPVAPTRSLFGFADEKGFLVLRVDADYNVRAYNGDVQNELVMSHGLGIFLPTSPGQRAEYPDFKRDSSGILVQTAGSVLRFDEDLNVIPESRDWPRVRFIHGDITGGYYGFHSARKFEVVNSTVEVKKGIDALSAQAGEVAITGVAVNNATGLVVMSAKTRLKHGDKAASDYWHGVYKGGRTYDLGCASSDPDYRFSETNTGGVDGIWVQSIRVNLAARTVVYLPGGPNMHVPITDFRQFDYLLKAGFNVDVVNYGGSSYTFTLSERLSRLGYRSLKDDMSNLDRYLAAHYERGATDLLMSSFGAQFYRYLPDETVARFRKVVFVVPSGTIRNFTIPGKPDSAVRFRKLIGGEIFDNRLSNSYFENLTACPIQGPAAIVTGTGDTRVDPKYDYRHCLGQKNITVYEDGMAHSPGYRDIAVEEARRAFTVNYLAGDSDETK